jgi:hypothetical protein
LGDLQQHAGARGVGHVGVGRRAILGDAADVRPPLHGRVVNVEAAVGRVIGVEGEAEQAHLAAPFTHVWHGEERRLHQRAVADDADAARLLHDEQPRSVAAGLREEDRPFESADHFGQRQLGHPRVCCNTAVLQRVPAGRAAPAAARSRRASGAIASCRTAVARHTRRAARPPAATDGAVRRVVVTTRARQ